MSLVRFPDSLFESRDLSIESTTIRMNVNVVKNKQTNKQTILQGGEVHQVVEFRWDRAKQTI